MFKSLIKTLKAARVMDYYHGAREYILKNYISPVKPQSLSATDPANGRPSTESGGHYSLEIDPYISEYFRDSGGKSEDDFEQKFSIKEGYSISESKDGPISFSMDDDSYNADIVDSAMKAEITERSFAALDALLDRAVKQSFVEKVIEIIRQKGVRDSVVYKAAQIDRRLFSKIMSDKNYKPGRDTAIAIALALQLPLAEANDLLERAGYTLSHSNKRDVVIEYFFRERMYSLNKINGVLAMLYLKPIGR